VREDDNVAQREDRKKPGHGRYMGGGLRTRNKGPEQSTAIATWER
jgi:hypothetical protein